MARPLFSVITWVNNKGQYAEMVKSFAGVDCEFVPVGQDCKSMAEAYNQGTELAQGKYLVYCHQDAKLMDPQFTEKVENLFRERPNTGFAGLVGATTNSQRSVWCHEPRSSYRGRVYQTDRWIRFGASDCAARILDGFFLVTDKRIEFPELLPHIHFLDAWICRAAEAEGFVNWVIDIDAYHLSKGNFWSPEFARNQRLYREYWYGSYNGSLPMGGAGARSVPGLSVVIAAYNGVEYTRAVVSQLRDEAAGAEIIVVDNGSTDGTGEWLSEQRDLRVITFEENMGVSHAWNSGLAIAGGDVLAVLNNDVDIHEDGIIRLYDKAVEVGISCAKMMRVSPDFKGGIAVQYYEDSDYANGDALFFRRDVWHRVGPFDESYRLAYFEDTDWSCRARLAGYSWMHVPNAITHFGSKTSQTIPEVRQQFSRNRLLFVDRWKAQGVGVHLLVDCRRAYARAVEYVEKLRAFREQMPLCRIFVACRHEDRALYDSLPFVDYVGGAPPGAHVTKTVEFEQHSNSSLVLPRHVPSTPAKVLVTTLTCDRKKASQLAALSGIEALTYGNFDVYINIQTADLQGNFGPTLEWAERQRAIGRNVLVDAWDWQSTWCREPGFDQDPARIVPISVARNMTLQAASLMDYDYVLQVDSDVIVPPHSIERLLEEDLPIVGGLVPGRGAHDMYVYVMGRSYPLDDERTVCECSTAGFVMLRRDVFQHLRYRYGQSILPEESLRSEDPLFFQDAHYLLGFGNPVVVLSLKASHWDDPEKPLTHDGTDRRVSVLRSNPDI